MSGKRLWLATAAVLVAAAGISTAVYGFGGGPSGGAVPADPPEASPQAAVTIPAAKCKTAKAEVVASDDSLTTTSQNYVPVQGMAVTFKTSTKQCVLVNFSAYAFAPGTNKVMYVTATLDAFPGSPALSQFTGGDDTVASAHSALFVFPLVPVGQHTVAILFKSNSTTEVALHRPAMSVMHN
jgi:hypothetical protein